MIVVDTGPPLFDRKIILPVGTIERVDTDEQRIHIDRTKDELKDAPSFHQ